LFAWVFMPRTGLGCGNTVTFLSRFRMLVASLYWLLFTFRLYSSFIATFNY
jgi:hypothetical protein